jgi:hypothetical protein
MRGTTNPRSVDRPVMPHLTYFKRYRMELDLGQPLPPPELPSGFDWLAWDEALLELHAEVKYLCFQGEIDATVFPSLGNRYGCRELMTAIRRKVGFCMPATWLISGPDGCCATVQGVRDRTSGFGAIQNLGVVPSHRGRGLGKALLLQALHGFRAAGIRRGFLEVTARNDAAVRMYRSIGFRSYKTVYRAVEVPDPVPVMAGI